MIPKHVKHAAQIIRAALPESHRRAVWIEALGGFERAEIVRVVLVTSGRARELTFVCDELQPVTEWIVAVVTGEREFREPLPVDEFRQRHWKRDRYRWSRRGWDLMNEERVRIAALRARMRQLGEELRRRAS